MPFGSSVVSIRKFQPTFGHPGRLGNTAQTSGRLPPYPAFPYGIPSTLTLTLAIAKLLSSAQPLIAAIPLNGPLNALGTSMEICTGLFAVVQFATANVTASTTNC